MKKQLISFINYRYMSMTRIDFILKILSHFAYSYIMIIPTTFVIFDVQKNGFGNVSFLDKRVIMIFIVATALSITMGIISIVIYCKKTKCSVILLRGLTYSYIMITLFFLSCFNNFEMNVINICSIIIKLVALGVCIALYKNYLFKKKLPNIEQIIHGKIFNFSLSFLLPALVIFIRPLLMLFFKDNFGINFNWLVSATEFFLSLCLVVNVVETFTKAYFAKKYSL